MNVRQQNHLNTTLAVLQERGDYFACQILHERQRGNKLQHELIRASDHILSLRNGNKMKAIELMNIHNTKTTTNDACRRVDGMNPSRLAEIAQKKLLKNLESKLNKVLVRENQVQNENDQIKKKIDKFRVKICQDYLTRSLMEKKINEIQREMDFILENASFVSEQRDSLINERQQIILEAEEAEESHHEELKKLDSFIIEENELLGQSISAAASAVLFMSGTEDGKTESVIHEEEGAIVNKIQTLQDAIEVTRTSLEKTESKILRYNEAFSELRKVSKLSTIEEIANAFVQQQEETFATFHYIQRLTQEAEILEEQYTTLKHEMNEYSQDQIDQEAKRLSVFCQYQRLLNQAQEERQRLEAISNEGKDAVKQIAQYVQKLYIKLRCCALDPYTQAKPEEQHQNRATKGSRGRSTQSFLPTLLSEQGLSERNILRSMELIEKRSMQLISEYAKYLATSLRERRPSIILTPKVFERIRSLHTAEQEGVVHSLEMSESEEYSSDSDFSKDSYDTSRLQKPISLDEIRKRTAARHTFIMRSRTPVDQNNTRPSSTPASPNKT